MACACTYKDWGMGILIGILIAAFVKLSTEEQRTIVIKEKKK